MNFKKPKEEVINEAFWAAQSQVGRTLSSRLGHHDPGPQSIRMAIEQAISDGIEAAVRSLVENTYTDQEFEQDLTLRS